jgi:GTP-binding protein EngB required for normal cell division
MNSQQVKQNIQAIQSWSQENVILSGTQKDHVLKWCEDLSTKLNEASRAPLKIGLLGGTGVGKSTIINRLAGTEISVAKNERPYTNKVVVYHYNNEPLKPDFDLSHMSTIHHDRKEISHLILFDFPDYDSHLSEHRLMVQEVSQLLDIIVWVASPEKYADHAMIQIMSSLLQSSNNYCFVLNKTDLLAADETAQIIGHWHVLLRQNNIIEAPIFSFSAINDHGDTFQNFQEWLLQKRSENELKEITRANLENQIKQKAHQICQQIDCQQIEIIVEDVNKQMNQLNRFHTIRQKDFLERITPDALTAIHQYMSRQSRFVWPVGIAFGLIGRLKQQPLRTPASQISGNMGEFFLKTIDDAIAQTQMFPAVPDKKISLVASYTDFINRYQDPNQIAPLLGHIGFVQSIFFLLKQWIVLCIPFVLCLIYLSGIDQLSIESMGFKSFLLGCFQIIIKLFQPEGLIAMMSLCVIELFLSMQLASGWHKKLSRKSHGLYHTLNIQLCKQLMVTLHDTLNPLLEWTEQARLDCEKIQKMV